MFTHAQLKVIESSPSDAVVYAAPGSGKTTVLTNHVLRQIIDGRIEAESTACLTFTQQSARELKERLVQLMPEEGRQNLTRLRVGTFHAQVFKMMMQMHANIPLILSPVEQYRMVKSLAKQYGDQSGDHHVQAVLRFISASKSGEAATRLSKATKRVVKAYEQLKALHNRWDFDDILYQFKLKISTQQSEYVNKVPPVKYLLIDEFQDTNQIQWDILVTLRQLVGAKIFVVGDDDQAIYGFRGASPKWLLDFPKKLPKSLEFYLEENFRSDRQIIHHASQLIKHNRTRVDKELKVMSSKRGICKFYTWKNEDDEANGVGKQIGSHASNQTVAVLARTREQLTFVAARIKQPSVTFSTFHGAKGREWDVVHLVGLVNENPYLRQGDDIDEEEERRLFYVAMTRARHALFVHCPRKVKGRSQRLSNFIEEAGFEHGEI